ncbi:MAG: hypothetical protein ABJO57_00450 [Lentilitoribacter sp.]
MSIQMGAIPDGGLLARYDAVNHAYTDCFKTEVDQNISFEDYARAFFNSPVFKLERIIIALTTGKKTSEQSVDDLISGRADDFAVWQVEDRADNQILMKVGDGQIRTWLMSEQNEGRTLFYFGSAILPFNEKGDKGFLFHALSGFHKLYARILLWMAKKGV